MIVRMFLLWARNAPPGDRADATAALAKAYLYSDLSDADRREAETALTAMLDDGSPLVRRAMADSLGPSPDAPRHIILTLAGDGGDAAAFVLERSPLLLDADLVDCAALGDERAQAAIAGRPSVSPAVSAALAEIAGPGALAVLARNPGAAIGHAALTRMLERHGDSGTLRESLLVRPDLPVDIAQAIAAALAKHLESFVTGCGWLSPERSGRVAREAKERTTVALSASSEEDEVRRLVGYLRRSDQLTPALILRAILSGQVSFAVAAFADLTGRPAGRIGAIFRDPHGFGFKALFARTGLSPVLQPAFQAALLASRRGGPAPGSSGGLSRGLIETAMAACSTLPPQDATRLVALLRRFEVEAARDEARQVAGNLADEAALALVLKHAPQALAESDESRSLAA